MISVKVTPLCHDHASLGLPIKATSKVRSVTMSMVADTGCQSTIMPLQSVFNLGLTKQDLLPVRLQMHGAIKEDLGVIGEFVIKVATQGADKGARGPQDCCVLYLRY